MESLLQRMMLLWYRMVVDVSSKRVVVEGGQR